ncbi:MAG: autotransporter-associated beta strand repeat-containing protein, partial [Verrucomicrobia bacterium]|nr:autotransporter-associated beta strand repeat-containing protein [Verrucomicrobiota bacterium]
MKPRQQSTVRRPGSLLIAVSFAMSLSAVHAASLTWDGNGATEPNPNGGAGTWDGNSTANWWDGASNVKWPAAGGTDNDAVFANTAGTVALAAGGVTANDLSFSTTGYLIQSNTLTLNGTTPTLTTDPGVSATISSVVSGAAGLVKSGSGTLTLSGINNYSGGTNVNAGKLTLDLSARSGGMQVGTFAIGASGTLEIAGGTNTGVDNKGFEQNSVFTGTGTITKTGIGYFGLFVPVGFRDFAGLIDIQQGVLGNNSAGWGSGAGLMDLNITAGAFLDMRTQNIKIDALSGGGTIEKTYTPALTLSLGNNDGSATFSGVISQTIGGGGGTIAVTKNGSGKQTLSGTMTYSGVTTINAGTLELQTPGSFASNIVVGAANSPTLQLSSPLVTDIWTLAQQISGGSASAKLEKTGLGTVVVTLSGGSSFVGTSSGALTVAAGTLYINNSFTTAPTVSVAGGARFGGASTVANVTVGNAGTLEGGTSGSGTLTAADVTLGSVVTDTATLKGTLSTTVGYKPLAVTNLTLNGGNNSVTLDASGAGLTNGSYNDLLVSTNAITAPNASSVAAVFKSNSRSYTPNVDGTKVQLYYDAAASVYWSGAASSAWNTAATNWKLSGNNTDTQFLAGDVVFFHDSPAGSTVDISSGDVSPSSTTFDNTTATAYTLQGSNGIATGTLAKSGNGILTITNANSFGGGTTLSAGTLNIEHSSALGSGSVAINGGTLNLNNAAALGAGLLVIDGGTLNLNNASTLGSGSLVINTGTLNLNNAAALGSRTLAINGGVLDNPSGVPITLTTNNAQTWGGDVVFTGSNNLNLGSGAVSMPASREVSVTAGTLTVGGAISGTGPLSKSGGGVLTLGGINSYSGGTNVHAGKLTLDLSARSGGMQVGTFAIGASGTLEIAGGTNPGVDNKGFEQNSVFNGTGTITKTGIGYFGLFLNVGFRDFAGLIDIQEGVLGNNSTGWGSGAGLMDLNIAAGAFLDMRTQNIKIDALSGAGTIEKTYVPALTLSLGNNDGSATFSGVISQTIGGGGGTIAVLKNGSGTQTLTGTSTYTGATTVNGGTLALAEDATLASPTITVASGARLDTSGLTADFTLAPGQTLSAGRTAGFAEDVAGNLVISDGSLHIAGTGNTAGTLTQTGKLTLGGGTLKFDLAAATTPGDGVNDLIAVTGDLALVDSTSITINKLSGALSAGTYTLISCTGTLTGDAATNLYLDFPNTGRQSYALANTASSVVLSVTGIPASLVWTGADYTHPTFWDLNTTANWSGGPNGKFADG